MENHLGGVSRFPQALLPHLEGKIKFKSSVQALEENEVDACVRDKGQYAKSVLSSILSTVWSPMVIRYCWLATPGRMMPPGGVRTRKKMDPIAGGGASALFESGQLTSLLPDLIKPEHNIHFAGEHTDVHHTWIVGALNSAIYLFKNIRNGG
ncbi:hypothetical protein BC938DRAFT_471138 [Jimgerdemannia flammicorona]|uniref:Amine oxidase domain-containing protein n=1 Tax=Jimgerdemannia flammicorona TaxID=994334 RepID=A0A433Q8S3_9FUNG|nr:hypothetical protein BC938DRAFT_471138 [Jimgerdemannia flammicorona]